MQLADVGLGNRYGGVPSEIFEIIKCVGQIASLGLVLQRLSGDCKTEFNDLTGLAHCESISLDGVGVVDVLDSEVLADSVEDIGRKTALCAHSLNAIGECAEVLNSRVVVHIRCAVDLNVCHGDRVAAPLS